MIVPRDFTKVTISGDDAGSGKAGAERCSGCGAAFSASQRYCMECGTRRGPLPAVVAERVNALKDRGRADGTDAGSGTAPAEPEAATLEDAAEKKGPWSFMPSPQVAAVAVMALLAAGVVLGSVTSPLAQSAGVGPLLLEIAGGSPEEEEESTAEPAGEPGFAPEPTASAAAAEVPLVAPLAPPPAPVPSAAPPQPPPELPEEELLPEIKHVFLIALNGHGYEEAFGKESPAPYLAETLAGEGKLLANYYAVTQGGLANEVALLSGQGPTPQTALGCPEYKAIAPGTVSLEGQVEGDGCLYPAETDTLPGQLAAAELTWKAYVEEDTANTETPEQIAGCALTPRNPVAYFAGLTESPECAESDVGLDRLAPDLEKAGETPSFSYIVPSACHDGSDTPCAPDQPAGLAAAEGFLKTVVPEITASPAYKEEGGLIAITFDQASQAGPEPDTSSCCATPEYPNMPAPVAPPAAEPPATGPVKPTGGGGRVGMLLISPYVAPGTVEEAAYFNHFSFLRSVEELFGLEPLGYAAEPALTGFDSAVYDASPEESTVTEPPPASPSH